MIPGHLRDIGILTKKTPKITPYSGNRIRKRAWEKVIKGLLFNRVHVLGNGFAVDQGVEDSVTVFPYPTYSFFGRLYETMVITEVAPHLVISFGFP